MIKEKFFKYKEKIYSLEKCLSVIDETYVGMIDNIFFDSPEELLEDYLEYVNYEYDKNFSLEDLLNIIGCSENEI